MSRRLRPNANGNNIYLLRLLDERHPKPLKPMTLEILSSAEIAVPPFVEFPSIARLARECVVTEKIDGTNAQVHITEDGRMFAGSRSKWISPDADNFGFAKWVQAHRDELMALGTGSHFGEWWGSGVQRGYGLGGGEKRWSLFNVGRWAVKPDPAGQAVTLADKQEFAPACCSVVPILYAGEFDTAKIEATLTLLGTTGSQAAPGFANPEGIVIYHEKARVLFKKTLGDDGNKGSRP